MESDSERQTVIWETLTKTVEELGRLVGGGGTNSGQIERAVGRSDVTRVRLDCEKSEDICGLKQGLVHEEWRQALNLFAQLLHKQRRLSTSMR